MDEGSVFRRDLYLTTRNIHNKQTSMSPAGFEPAIPSREQPQSQTLDFHWDRLISITVKRVVAITRSAMPCWFTS